MKKTYQNQIKGMLTAIALVSVLLAACVKTPNGQIQDASTNRSFTPLNLNVKTVKDSAIFTWTPQLYAVKGMAYTLDISTDSTFAAITYTTIADTTGAIVTDDHLLLNTPYYSRVRVNPYNGSTYSKYLYKVGTFKLTGLQYLKLIRENEITTTSVLLHWYQNASTAGITSIVVTPATGSAITTSVSSATAAAGTTTISGLTAGTKYTVQLFEGTKSMGLATFSTPATVNFTTIITPTTSLATTIANASNGDVIGLSPGTYSLTGVTPITQKSITIRSTSNDPTTTKILLRELDLVGTGAGLTLGGIEVNGNYSGTSYGVTAFVLIGSSASTGVPAQFKNLIIDNCIIHEFTRDLIRANYATNPNDHQIGTISINNSITYNIDPTGTSGYYMISLEKLQINTLSVTKSTFYAMGDGMLNMSTVLLTTSGVIPNITWDADTFNNFGSMTKYAFFDATSNQIVFNFTNSILANFPLPGASIQGTAFRATGTKLVLNFSNNEYFNLYNAQPGLALVLTGLTQANDINVNLGWTSATTNFLLVPSSTNGTVFTASSSGSTVGDPRWAY